MLEWREPSHFCQSGLRLPMRGVQTALHSAGKELAGRSDAAVFPRFRGQWTQAQFICVHSDVCCSYLLTLHLSKNRLCAHLTGGGTYLQVGHIMGTCESHGRDSVGDVVPTATGKATWAQLTPHGGSRLESFPSLQRADGRLPTDPPPTTKNHVASPSNLRKRNDSSGFAH